VGRGVRGIPSDAGAGAKDFALAYDLIENMEQAVIQHVRTSGIRKPRETSLIDELMDIRRERRKLFSALGERSRSLSTQCEGLLGDLAHLRDQQGRSMGRLESQVESLRAELHSSQTTFATTLASQLSAQQEKSQFLEQLAVQKVKKRCEEKMLLLEEKVDQVMREKRRADLSEARAIATELLGKAKVEMEKKYCGKIHDYKQSLVAVSSREADLAQSVARYRQLVGTYEEEGGILRAKLGVAEQQLAAYELRENDLKLTALSAEQRAARLEQELRTAGEAASAFEAEKSLAVERVGQEAEQRLVKLDERVRRMVAGKDGEIKALKMEGAARQVRLDAAEEALAQLSRDIVAVKRR